MTDRVPTLVDLPSPRALSDAERALATRLAAFADVPGLSEQVATACVVSVCDCGCASVGLRTEAPAVPEAVVTQVSSTGRDDYFAVYASAGPQVSVVLHILSGSIGELEIFAGDGVAVTPPPVESVIDLWLE